MYNVNMNYYTMLSDLLKKINSTNSFDKEATNALRDYIKKFIVYALDVNQINSKDIETSTLDLLHEKLRKSKFMTKRKKLRGIAVENGLSSMVFSVVDGKVFFDVYKVSTPFVEVADKLRKVFVYKDNDYINDGDTDKQVYYKFETINGKTIKTKYKGEIGGKPSSFELMTNAFAEYDVMPVVILPNNENYESTFKYVSTIIEAAGRHLNNIDKEWEYDKSMLINQNFFNPERDAETLQRQVEGNDNNADGSQKRAFDDKDPNGLGGQSIQYLSSGGISSQVAQRNYDKFKQEALFYSLSWLVVSDGKTNKHGAEVITSQLPTFNHIQYQIELLQEFYSHFIFILHNMMISTKELEAEKLIKLPLVKIELSKYMEAIVDMNNKDGENNIISKTTEVK